MVLEFPPKLSLSSHVKTESLYGMKGFFFCSPDASADVEEERETDRRCQQKANRIDYVDYTQFLLLLLASKLI